MGVNTPQGSLERTGSVANANDDLAEGSFFEAAEGFAGFFEGVDRVDDGVQLDLVEFAQHVFESTARADGDATQDAVFLNEGEERDGGVVAVDEADDGDLSCGRIALIERATLEPPTTSRIWSTPCLLVTARASFSQSGWVL